MEISGDRSAIYWIMNLGKDDHEESNIRASCRGIKYASWEAALSEDAGSSIGS